MQVSASTNSQVGTGAQPQNSPENSNNCWVDAGKRYGIDPWLLYSIAEHESGHRAKIVSKKNTDGTYDLGMMQINSWWFPILEKRYGILKEHLFDACMNINVGAWILAQSIQSAGSVWEGVGAYNAGLKKTKERAALRKKYSDAIASIYARHRDRLRVTTNSNTANRS